LQSTDRLSIIGIGGRPLGARAHRALLGAGVVVATSRLYDVFAAYAEFAETREKIRRADSVEATLGAVREALAEGRGPVVLLASGDPLFFGIGRRILKEFGREGLEIIPDVSSIQLAFARVKEPWDGALLISLHAGQDPRAQRRLPYGLADVAALAAAHETLAVLTDKEHNPAAIAAALASAGAARTSALLYVCERLGYDDERVTAGRPDEIAAMSFAEPNVVIIKRQGDAPQGDAPPLPPRLGLREEEIGHSGGLITKDEIRAVVLHSLRLPASGVFWDIGAGSGALSLEAARLCPGLAVYAVEKAEEQLEWIQRNASAFGLAAIRVVRGEAPTALAGLPPPCRIFIGGSGGRLREILDFVREATEAGIVVVNAATLETLDEALRGLEGAGYAVRVSEVWVARSKVLGERRAMAGLNPVFIVIGERR
jgi:precorrin-6Y C5,15-methyltransferase (decarboxylating)